MSRKKEYSIPGAVSLAEQAVQLLLRTGAPALSEYYLGGLPFALALLYFWSDMSRNPFAGWYCAPAAAGLALLFIWMKYWQVRFCRRLYALLQDAPVEEWSMQRSLAVAARQALLHATGVVVLPVSILLAFPLGWTYAFYQNLSTLEEPATPGIAALYSQALQQSMLWPGHNHLFLSIMSLFGLVVSLNLAMAIIMLPLLLRMLLGIETVFTLSGLHVLNTSFIAVLCVLSYLCIDPILKAAYVLRCFHGKSRQSGDDIRAGLKTFLKSGIAAAVLMIGLMVSDLKADAPAGAIVIDQPQTAQAYAERLDESIQSVLQQPHFAWRLPRDLSSEKEDEKQSWVVTALKWVWEQIKSIFRPVGKWLETFFEWLEKIFRKITTEPESGAGSRGAVRVVFILVGGVVALALIALLWRWWKGLKPVKPAALQPEAGAAPDLRDENVTAEDLPADGWLELARELLAAQSLQLALRALYLSVLALLADRHRIVIARHKSNQEYYRELARRAHAEPELMRLFAGCLQRYERSWYGMHAVSEAQWHEYLAFRTRIEELVAN